MVFLCFCFCYFGPKKHSRNRLVPRTQRSEGQRKSRHAGKGSRETVRTYLPHIKTGRVGAEVEEPRLEDEDMKAEVEASWDEEDDRIAAEASDDD